MRFVPITGRGWPPCTRCGTPAMGMSLDEDGQPTTFVCHRRHAYYPTFWPTTIPVSRAGGFRGYDGRLTDQGVT